MARNDKLRVAICALAVVASVGGWLMESSVYAAIWGFGVGIVSAYTPFKLWS